MVKRTITYTVTFIIATTLLLTGCGQPKNGTDRTEIAPTESNRWLELLGVLPENEETLKAAYLQDTAYMLEKITQPEYAVGHNLPMFGQSPGSYSDEEWKATLGFVAADVDQTIYAGSAPPRYYEAVRGRLNQEDIDSAAKTGPMNEILEVTSYAGHEFYSWGEDFGVNLAMRSNVRPLGRGHRLALVDDFIFWMLWTDGIEEMIDSYEGNIESLADIEDYRLLAEALEELDVCYAFFSSEPQSQSRIKEVYKDIIDDPANNERRQTFVEEIQRPLLLKPYQALATGAGIDEKGYFMAIVLINPSEAIARDNAVLLERRIGEAKNVAGMQEWSDLIQSMEIESKGRLTTARLYGEVCTYWSNFSVMGMLGPYEPLLLHE